MNLLLIRLSSMGDVILVSSVISWLHQNRPHINIYLVTGNMYAPLFRDDPRVQKVIGISKEEQLQLEKESQARKWDLIVDLQNSTRSRALCRSLFPGVARGQFDKRHFARAVLLTARINIYKQNENVVSRYVRATSQALSSIETDHNKPSSSAWGCSSSHLPSLRLFFDDAEACIKKIVSQSSRPVLALFPFAAWKNKQWPLDRYAAVGKHFRDKGWRIFIMGGRQDKPLSNRIQAMIGEHCSDLTGRTSLRDAGWVLKNASLALGNDTGLSHLARACGVAGGIIFGSTTHHLGFFPYGNPPYAIFEKGLWCRPCHAHGGNICLRLNRSCLGEITTKNVIEGMENLSVYSHQTEKNENSSCWGKHKKKINCNHP